MLWEVLIYLEAMSCPQCVKDYHNGITTRGTAPVKPLLPACTGSDINATRRADLQVILLDIRCIA